MKLIAEKYVFIKDILGLLIIQTVGTSTFIEWIEEKSMNRMEKECHNCQAEAYFGEAKIGLRDSLVVFTGDLFADVEQHPKVGGLGKPKNKQKLFKVEFRNDKQICSFSLTNCIYFLLKFLNFILDHI